MPTSSPDPSAVGQSVTLTAGVSPVGSTPATPTGSVTFQVGSTFLGPVPLINGTATLTTSVLPAGSDTIAAYYGGDSNFTGSRGSFVQTVYAVTQTTLTSGLNPSLPTQSVTFTATAAGSPTPTGAVQFAIDSTNVGGPVTLNGSGQATDTATCLTPGAHTVTAVYTPTGLFLGNAGAVFTQTVNPHISPQYVSPSGSDSGDGSQASPKRTIQAAVNNTLSGDTVIVEDGTYTGSGNRDIDFAGRSIIVQSASGDPTSTIIDCGGSINASHCGFTFHSKETNAVISGLTIQHGYEEETSSGVSLTGGSDGGAVAVASGSTVTLTNCILTGNRSIGGGGVYNDGTLTLTGCALTGNNADDYGGGLYSLGTVSAVNCVFAGNSVGGGYGGGVTNGGTAVFTGCTFTGNSATPQSGGLLNVPNGTLTDDIVYGNTGGEIALSGGTLKVSYCDVEGGCAGTGNINADPLFVSAATGDFHLRRGSPCLGAGAPVPGLTVDKDGTPLPSRPSMGAYDLAPISVSGVVSLQGVGTGYLAHILTLTLTPTGGTAGGVANGYVIPDANTGSFTLSGVPLGTYTLGVKGSKWMRTDVAVDTTGGSVTGLSVSLLGGDVNNDNQVSLQDLGALRAAYGSTPSSPNWDLRADLNCDGQVSLQDLGILRSNYGRIGDP